MPQTREHIAILDLLGIETGVVVLTKVDRVDAARLHDVMAKVREVVTGTFLEGADIFSVSNLTGEGLVQLEEHLMAMAELFEPRDRRGHFRMTVDRCFKIHGAGLVVTGSAFSGAVESGSSAVVSPAGAAVRVRGIHALNEPAQTGHAGLRVALNLSGPGAKKVRSRRGDWIVVSQADNRAAIPSGVRWQGLSDI